MNIEYKKLQNTVEVASIDGRSLGEASVDAVSSSSNLLSDHEYAAALSGNVTLLAELDDAPGGRHLGLFSTLILFVSRILGSGFLAVSSGIYEDCGRSPFFFFAAWLISAILAYSGLYVFLELGSLLPRSGGVKVFLEFIYDKPYMLVTVAYLVFSVIFGFTLLNILVFGEYFLHSIGIEPTEFRTRLTALLFLYMVGIMHGVSKGHGVRVQNIIGALKLLLAGVMIGTGIYVSFLPTSVTHIESNLHWSDFFTVKTKISVSSFASAVIKTSFAYGGWNAVHTVANEIKDPVRTFKIAGPLALAIVTVTYIFTNLAYLVVLLEDEMVNSGKLIGSVLFQKVFGKIIGKNLLTLSAALCAGGNVIVVLFTISRTSQEVFREGVLPFSNFMASNWPYDAPLPTIALSCSISTLVIFCVPGKGIYEYIISLETYPNNIFIGLAAVGVFIIRKRYPEVRAPIRAHFVAIVLLLIISLYLAISPVVAASNPNPKGMEDWPSYALVSLMCLIFCVLYWVFMFKLFPWYFNYTLVKEDIVQEDGLAVKRWVKVGN